LTGLDGKQGFVYQGTLGLPSQQIETEPAYG